MPRQIQSKTNEILSGFSQKNGKWLSRVGRYSWIVARILKALKAYQGQDRQQMSSLALEWFSPFPSQRIQLRFLAQLFSKEGNGRKSCTQKNSLTFVNFSCFLSVQQQTYVVSYYAKYLLRNFLMQLTKKPSSILSRFRREHKKLLYLGV